jgi:uncharacterized protein
MPTVTVGYHGVARCHFDALAAGGGGQDAVAELAKAQYSKHLLLLRAVFARARADELVQAGCRLLAQVERHDPAAARAVIGHPSFGAWAHHLLRGSEAPPGRLAAIAAAAAVRARLPAEIKVPIVGGIVMLPTLGTAAADGRTATVRVTSGGRAEVASSGTRTVVRVGVDQEEEPGWLPLRRFSFGTRSVLIDDLDPYRMPALATLAPRLSNTEADQWTVMLREAWSLLSSHHQEAASEVAAAVTVIVPHATPESGRSSATTAETFGAVALSRPDSACATAVDLMHEMQHLKLFALLDVVALTLPDDHLYYAPWRPDPRPIGGLLQGAYAFLGVSGFWRRQRFHDTDLHGHIEYAKWLGATWLVIETLLTSGQLTAAGEDFVRVMARTTADWLHDRLPEQARMVADTEARNHRARWERENGRLPGDGLGVGYPQATGRL